jgi:hypothetical protein
MNKLAHRYCHLSALHLLLLVAMMMTTGCPGIAPPLTSKSCDQLQLSECTAAKTIQVAQGAPCYLTENIAPQECRSSYGHPVVQDSVPRICVKRSKAACSKPNPQNEEGKNLESCAPIPGVDDSAAIQCIAGKIIESGNAGNGGEEATPERCEIFSDARIAECESKKNRARCAINRWTPTKCVDKGNKEHVLNGCSDMGTVCELAVFTINGKFIHCRKNHFQETECVDPTNEFAVHSACSEVNSDLSRCTSSVRTFGGKTLECEKHNALPLCVPKGQAGKTVTCSDYSGVLITKCTDHAKCKKNVWNPNQCVDAAHETRVFDCQDLSGLNVGRCSDHSLSRDVKASSCLPNRWDTTKCVEWSKEYAVANSCSDVPMKDTYCKYVKGKLTGEPLACGLNTYTTKCVPVIDKDQLPATCGEIVVHDQCDGKTPLDATGNRTARCKYNPLSDKCEAMKTRADIADAIPEGKKCLSQPIGTVRHQINNKCENGSIGNYRPWHQHPGDEVKQCEAITRLTQSDGSILRACVYNAVAKKCQAGPDVELVVIADSACQRLSYGSYIEVANSDFSGVDYIETKDQCKAKEVTIPSDLFNGLTGNHWALGGLHFCQVR